MTLKRCSSKEFFSEKVENSGDSSCIVYMEPAGSNFFLVCYLNCKIFLV